MLDYMPDVYYNEFKIISETIWQAFEYFMKKAKSQGRDFISQQKRGSATNEEIWKACEDAAIADDIRALPLGLETEITDANSGGFSGGQKQRILIARAFLSKPSVMILDEATSALDNITQAKVLQSVYAMESTVIMVAHRLSTVKNCDRIIVLKDGHIEEQGKYEELLEKGGYFSELVAMQQLQISSG